MEERAHEAPFVADIAAQLGISARSLSEGFRRFRGVTPHDYLTARRLDGLRKALEEAPPGQTVSSIAGARGYVNLTAMTAFTGSASAKRHPRHCATASPVSSGATAPYPNRFPPDMRPPIRFGSGFRRVWPIASDFDAQIPEWIRLRSDCRPVLV